MVTPRRGKAVEINALWYNALCLMAGWLGVGRRRRRGTRSPPMPNGRKLVQSAFLDDRAAIFTTWSMAKRATIRPAGQTRSSRSRSSSGARPAAMGAGDDAVRERLLTPVGLRSLAPGEPDYKPKYVGDLRARDAAYHQGTVWAWLIGPFIDAWLKIHPDEINTARSFLEGFGPHLNEAGIGSISEIFDAEAPFTPRGCIAQAWSVAEVLRCWVKTAPEPL